MQFLSSRSLNFGITIGGQRMIVMFEEPTANGVCSFITSNNDIAEAIRRHPYYKNNVVWEKGNDNKNDKAVKPDVKTQGTVAASETVAATRTEDKRDGRAVTNETKPETETKDEDEEQTFGNFTEAKEWFCKKYGVAKSTVKNPTALARVAEEKGVKIKIVA